MIQARDGSDATPRRPNPLRSPFRQFLYSLEQSGGGPLTEDLSMWADFTPPESTYFEGNEALVNLQITAVSLPPPGETQVAMPGAAATFATYLVNMFPVPRAKLEEMAKSLGIEPLPKKESLMREILYATGGTPDMVARLNSMSFEDLDAMARELRLQQRQ